MRFLILIFLFSSSLQANTTITDQEAEAFMKKYDSFFEKKEAGKIDEIYSPEFFVDKKTKAEFIENFKADKDKHTKSEFKIEKQNGEFKVLKVNKDRMFFLKKTKDGIRLHQKMEAE
ncbi:MAG: hypothetical protein ACOYL6_08510 [Bacteriovoracaceae bacterium]